ncbi:MAG: YjbH domain-containing protein [Rhodobacter sp.]|nr:YjbH domain-containing protein [Rhodobacter sp.]
MISFKGRCAAATMAALLQGTAPLHAEMRPSLSFSGVPGLIDMPSGEAMPDGTISVAAALFGPQYRTTLTFQITPRISGSYRFSATRNWNDITAGTPDDDGYDTYNDRSFDLRFLVLKETDYLPSITLGLQDFVGTGLASAEYIAATKTFSDRFKVTAGLGWGRLGSYGGIGSPFGDRPPIDFGMGGKPAVDQWFRGPVAPFAGIEWRVNDNWTVKAEYSSDAYPEEAALRGTFDRRSPFNFGVEYQRGQYMRFGLYSLYGSEIGLAFNLVLDPKQRATSGIFGPAPVAVGARPSRAADPEAYDGGWVTQPDGAGLLYANLSKRLAADGMTIEHFSYTTSTVHLRVRNAQIDAGPQAVGRAARALSQVMPASVEVFEIVPMVRGMGASKITIRRSDLEALEHAPGNDALLREKVQISDAGPAPAGGLDWGDAYPKFTWRLTPALRISQPLVGDVGLRFSASYELRPGLVLSGAVYQRVADNLDEYVTRPEDFSILPHVRSDVHDYNVEGGTSVDRLTLAWYAKPADNLYSRVTLGYLERMHAGVSGELLWKPVASRLALGVELNYTMQRDRDGGFGFSDYDYGIATGHVSAYYDFGRGFLGQVDVGRYLAGDVGATFSLDREFGNGVKVGAFATFTSASAAEFGEGSFDKGLRLTIPMNWILGQPSRGEMNTVLRPLQRDGGARVEVDGRLYDSISDYHLGRLDSEWGRVWR